MPVTVSYLVRVEQGASRVPRLTRHYGGGIDTTCTQRRTVVTTMIERPAAIDASGSGAFEDMLRTVEELDTPDGYKAELIRGKIVVSPWSKLRYKRVMKSLRQQLEPHAPEGHDVDVAPFLFSMPGAERAFGPDLHVADEAAFDAEGRHADGAALSLVAELTSVSTKDADWLDKLDAYGRVVPVYIVLDMQVQEITAFWDPSPKGYRSRTTVPFGRALHVPAPFDFELDTSGFAVPPESAEGESEEDSGPA
ncbi:Uma2 family endonuclease [Streptomyces acidicola]|uniref:Uma2 family endonuclease n=1 Tax=Streptomyces acidicola TaxID=2596892 RepID=UPI0034499D67